MADPATKIKKVAVIGAGVMGGIAAQMADAGVEVILLDMVPDGAANRNVLAEAAVKKQRETPRRDSCSRPGPVRSLAETWRTISASSGIATGSLRP